MSFTDMFDRSADMSWETVSLLKACLAMAGIFVLVLLYFNERLRDEALSRWTWRIALSLGIVGVAAYGNFGAFHWHKYPDSIHYYDFYHYYIGAKYFPELRYSGLYNATVIADHEGDRLISGAAGVKTIRNLESNLRMPLSQALEKSEEVKAAFTDDRWRDFTKDIGFFKDNMPPQHWKNVLQDLGYNATPVWMLAGSRLANMADSSKFYQMLALAWLDVLLMAGAFYLLYRAFGFYVLMLALLCFGINYTQRYQHFSGSLLRLDWLACLIAGLSLTKLERPRWAGFFLAYAAMLRIFPLAYLAGIGIRFCYLFYRDRALPRFESNLMVSAAVTALALCTLTLFQTGGLEGWRYFAEDIVPHSDRLTVKRIGVAYPFIYAGEMQSSDLPLGSGANRWEDFYSWREQRLAEKKWAIRPLQLAALALFCYLVCKVTAWEAVALGIILVYFFMNPARYYYAQLLVLVPLLSSSFGRTANLVALAALLATFVVMYAVDLTARFYNFQQFLMSTFIGLLLVFVACAKVYELRGNEVNKEEGRGK